MKRCAWIAAAAVLAASSAAADPVNCAVKVVYDGKGAGQVLFDGATHVGRAIACSVCHERRGLSLPLFEKRKGAAVITMHKMELGRACGYCHDVVDGAKCSRCHHKE